MLSWCGTGMSVIPFTTHTEHNLEALSACPPFGLNANQCRLMGDAHKNVNQTHMLSSFLLYFTLSTVSRSQPPTVF